MCVFIDIRWALGVSNKISQTGPNNHTTTYEFDKLNHRTKRTLPNTFFETYSYDSVGNLQTRKNFNGKTTTYAYDARNRVTSITPDPSIGGPGISFTYTASGRRASMTDASGATSWTYDNRDRVLTKAAPAGTLTYTWDAHGNVASVLSSNTGGVSVSYAWDTLNRLSSVTDNGLSSATSYTYDNIGNLATITYPNGVVHSFTYDAKDQPTSLQLTKTASVLASYSQVFGFSGQKTSVAETSGRAVSYSYDAVYKLLSEAITGATPAGSIGYTLDAVGNRLTRTSSLTGIAAQNLTYDAADRLTTDTYDNNGNTLTSGGNTYTYDFLDRLVTGPGVTMVYDGDGNRVSRTTSGVTTSFVVDDFTPTGYAQVAEEVVSGAVARRYTHGLHRISQTASSATSYYGYDGGLSVRQLFDGTGVTDTFDYDAFGNLIASTGSTQNVYLYRGEQCDPALGFYYLRARWMNTGTGRLFSVDSFEGNAKEPKTLNLYGYAYSNPADVADPSGHGIKDLAVRFPVFASVVAVIGSRAEVAAYECSAGTCNTLVNWLAGRTWTPELNQIWPQTIINGRQVVFLASDPRIGLNVWNGARYNGGYTYFWVEIQVLLRAGYQVIGNWMIPPM